MDARRALTNGVFCPMPWTGLMYNFDGTVKNCIRSAGNIGNLKNQNIQEILLGPVNLETQSRMLQDQPGKDCHTCYDLERGKKSFDIVSDRIFYIRELKSLSLDTYRESNHDLRSIDVRWSNLCNFACVYCMPEYSSRWASELDIQCQQPTAEQVEQFKTYILSNADNLKHVYLAGGEPLLMKQNLELLEALKQSNPDVNLRINTNLSTVDSKVFDAICEFKHVHWTVSVESMAEEFEYIRYGGSWQDFLTNLSQIKKLDHKISFNMLYFLLNFRSLFQCVDFLRSLGYHANSFIIGALIGPSYLNIRNLPNHVLDSIAQTLQTRLAERPGHLLEDSYKNLLFYIKQPFAANLLESIDKIQAMDRRRGIDSAKIFSDLYQLI